MRKFKLSVLSKSNLVKLSFTMPDGKTPSTSVCFTPSELKALIHAISKPFCKIKQAKGE